MSDERTPRRGRLREFVAEEIRVLLARQRISAAELARRTGIKQSTISRRMTGETAFDMDDLEVIARALGVQVQDLLPARTAAGEESEPPAIAHYFGVAERGSDHPDRPADNRPPGRSLAGAGAGPGRTAYLVRGARRMRD
jgi:transcriptional regulator with XRE-family HTH domain